MIKNWSGVFFPTFVTRLRMWSKLFFMSEVVGRDLYISQQQSQPIISSPHDFTTVTYLGVKTRAASPVPRPPRRWQSSRTMSCPRLRFAVVDVVAVAAAPLTLPRSRPEL